MKTNSTHGLMKSISEQVETLTDTNEDHYLSGSSVQCRIRTVQMEGDDQG